MTEYSGDGIVIRHTTNFVELYSAEESPQHPPSAAVGVAVLHDGGITQQHLKHHNFTNADDVLLTTSSANEASSYKTNVVPDISIMVSVYQTRIRVSCTRFRRVRLENDHL